MQKYWVINIFRFCFFTVWVFVWEECWSENSRDASQKLQKHKQQKHQKDMMHNVHFSQTDRQTDRKSITFFFCINFSIQRVSCVCVCVWQSNHNGTTVSEHEWLTKKLLKVLPGLNCQSKWEAEMRSKKGNTQETRRKRADGSKRFWTMNTFDG